MALKHSLTLLFALIYYSDKSNQSEVNLLCQYFLAELVVCLKMINTICIPGCLQEKQSLCCIFELTEVLFSINIRHTQWYLGVQTCNSFWNGVCHLPGISTLKNIFFALDQPLQSISFFSVSFSSPQMGICDNFLFSSINNNFVAHLIRKCQHKVLPQAESLERP